MDKIDELLTRGVENIYPSKEALEKVLRSGKKLRVYQGFDPTAPELHIGHAVGLRKLRQWQDLGHEVIFLIGDFTGMIGDPTGKDKTRVPLTKEQVLKNAQTYKEQAGRILRFSGENPVIIKYNSTWLAKMSIPEVLKLATFLTYQQVIERDMFQKRIKNNMDIAVSEFLYPLMQGYDSVAMDVDVEVGGNDQLFNMMTGRDLMHKMTKKEKFVMTTTLLTDSQGNKIGKTEGNAITICGKPEVLYAQIMSLSDGSIIPVFELATEISFAEINQMRKDLKSGVNPMVLKKKLAWTIVAMYNSPKDADNAQEEFERTVQKGETPKGIPTFSVSKLPSNSLGLVDLLMATGLSPSKSKAKRLLEQGAVEINSNVNRIDKNISMKENDIIRVGKKRFLRFTK